MKRLSFSIKSLLVLILVAGLVIALALEFRRNASVQSRIAAFARHPQITIELPAPFSLAGERVQIFGVSGNFRSIVPVENLSIVVTVMDSNFDEIASGDAKIYEREFESEFGCNITFSEPLAIGVYQVRATAFHDGQECISTVVPMGIRSDKELREGGIF